ncbi:MAG: 50S ribosomal protein L6 [Candidatus Omnitrophica bacterium]|jgi:large subunit ribosomal protein L6|nr:50S ribosomal protein L6 [Candidatus Omnitrophota bacterium]
MSRIGKQPVQLPKGVKASFASGSLLIEGVKGKLSLNIPKGVTLELSSDKVIVKRESEEKQIRSSHGTIRAIINNMVKGVVDGYKKELDIVGTGYKAMIKGTNLVLVMGFSHPVEIPVSKDLKVTVPNPNRVIVEGADRQKLGQFAAVLRKIYPPEPYKGKGIRYVGEEVKKKLGKALAK